MEFNAYWEKRMNVSEARGIPSRRKNELIEEILEGFAVEHSIDCTKLKMTEEVIRNY